MQGFASHEERTVSTNSSIHTEKRGRGFQRFQPVNRIGKATYRLEALEAYATRD